MASPEVPASLSKAGVSPSPALRTSSQGSISAVSTRTQAVSALLSSASIVKEQWTAIGLDSKRKVWEAQCLEIADFQEQSTKSRKELAEATRNFKQLGDDVKLTKWGELLKSYQAEIDRLTRRSKTAEQSFLTIYKPFHEAPDPAPMFETLTKELHELSKLNEGHNKALAELEEYRTEFQSLKNQEITIRRLEDKIKEFEKNVDDKAAEAANKERDNMEVELEKIREEYDERERDLVQLLQNARDAKAEAMRLHDEAQSAFFGLKAKFDEELAAKQSQIELLGEESDRSSQRALALEKEKELLNQQYLDLWKKHFSAPQSPSR